MDDKPIVGDLLIGAEAIAEYVDLTRRKVYDFNAQRVMPSFKIGKTVAARKLTLTKWIEDLEGS